MRRLLLAVLAALAMPTAASAAVPFPAPGTVETFTCTGVPFTETSTTWGEIADGVVSYSVRRSTGEEQLRKMAVWMRATSMNLESAGAEGTRSMELDYGSFEGLETLTPGTSYEGWVYESRPGKKRTHWRYNVKVSGPEKATVDGLGEVDVVRVDESRTAGSYSAKQSWAVVASTGETLSNTYTDNRGRDVKCVRAK